MLGQTSNLLGSSLLIAHVMIQYVSALIKYMDTDLALLQLGCRMLQ